ncbi:hypothetical protein [Prosthecobacter sp.]
MVSGSIAAIYYGEPRLTNDVDIILFLKREDIRRFEAAFPSEGFYCPPRDVLQIEAAREQRGHFNLLHHDSGFKADIYLSGQDELHEWGLSHAVEADLDGDRVRFAPPEYVIIRKLQFYREGGSEKHLRDISRMLLGLGEDWERGPLRQMILAHGLSSEWDRVASLTA